MKNEDTVKGFLAGIPKSKNPKKLTRNIVILTSLITLNVGLVFVKLEVGQIGWIMILKIFSLLALVYFIRYFYEN